jgi:hypothetical protein
MRLLKHDTIPDGVMLARASVVSEVATPNVSVAMSATSAGPLEDESWVVLPLLYTEVNNDKRYMREDECSRCGMQFTAGL